jgi:hypothetical protein
MLETEACSHRVSRAGSIGMALHTRRRPSTSPLMKEAYAANAGLKGGIGAYVAQGMAAGRPSIRCWRDLPESSCSGSPNKAVLHRLERTLASRRSRSIKQHRFNEIEVVPATVSNERQCTRSKPRFNPYVRWEPR